MVGDVVALVDRFVRIIGVVHHQRRRLDLGKDVAHVRVAPHAKRGHRVAAAHRVAQQPAVLAQELLITGV